MINLIPKEEKRKMVKGFYYKLVVLFLFTIDLAVLILFVAILPSYLLSFSKDSTAKTKLENQKSDVVPIPDEQTEAIIKSINSKVNLIQNAENNKFLPSKKVIDAVLAEKIPGLKIINISYQNDPLQGKKINIQGIAPSREVLLSFRLALENDNNFERVDLPISNFIKDSNIQFYLSLLSK